MPPWVEHQGAACTGEVPNDKAAAMIKPHGAGFRMEPIMPKLAAKKNAPADAGA
jgi:hypothetical protein